MIKKKSYTTDERTEFQFKAMELKKHGWNVDRIVEYTPTEDVITIAFGYNPSETSSVKEAVEVDAKKVKEENYSFIYWN